MQQQPPELAKKTSNREQAGLAPWFAIALLMAGLAAAQAQFQFSTNNGALTITNYTGTGAQVVIPAATNGLPITGIGDAAFFWKSGLRQITIPASITNIGAKAFAACFDLTNITVHPANLNYTSTDDVLFDKTLATLIQCPAGKAGAYTIPNDVTAIGNEAFYNCASVTNLTFGENVRNIGDSAYYLCFGLTRVTIPGSVTNIGPRAFFWTGLTNISVVEANQFYASEDGVLLDKSLARLIQYPSRKAGAYTMPDSVTTISDYALANCPDLETITFGNHVVAIPDNCFAQCSSLTGVNLSASITNIGNAAFHSCVNLTNLTMGNGIKTVGDSAFAYCYKLPTVTLPNSVTSIGADAFSTCLNLANVTIGANVTNIGSYAFYNCLNLTQVALPPSLTHLGYQAFLTSGLTNLTIPDSVTNFGDAPDSEGYNFAGCVSLVSATLPSNLTRIPPGLFAGCTSLQHIVIPQTVTNIATEAFDTCTALTSLIIPGSVRNIEAAAFAMCLNLETLYFLGDPPALGSQVFLDDSELQVYYLPGAVGWGATFGDRPAALWNPQATAFGTAGGQFGFNLAGPANVTLVIEAATNLHNPIWLPVATNVLSENGTQFFSDSQAANYNRRFYRLRSP